MVETVARSIMDLEDLKIYINHTQSIPNVDKFILGFRLGIILSEVDKIQSKLSSVTIDPNSPETKK